MKSNKDKKKNTKEPKIGKTVWQDIRRGNLKKTFKQDWKDLYYFYLDDEKRNRLSQMGRFRRYLHMLFWLFKSLVLKLSPLRRVLLFLSIILFLSMRTTVTNGNVNTSTDFPLIGFLLLLFVLALELKDKFVAQDELAVGRQVQFALLPTDNPEISGWDIWLYTQPANDVGGDLVDYLEINSSRLGMSLGDVAGKGLGAALLMAKLQATIRALAPISTSLMDLGAQLNHIFCRDGLPNRFVSLVYLELMPDNGSIQLLNAGHLPPILLTPSGLKELKRGDPALGLQKNLNFHEQNVSLEGDDMLIVYSDGLTEARNDDGEFFGESRLKQLIENSKHLTAGNAGNQILNSIARFIGDARPHDDISLIIIKRKTKNNT